MSSHHVLPFELVDIIVQYHSGDKYTLQSCTMVSRSWSSASQRMLFRNICLDLFRYSRMARLRYQLESNAHLQTLIRRISISQQAESVLVSDISLHTYMSCLHCVISLLPNLEFLAIDFLKKRGNPPSNDTLPLYLDLSHVPRSSKLVELELEFISTIEEFDTAFEALEGTNIKQVTVFSVVTEHGTTDVGASTSVNRLYLPSLECICLSGSGLPVHFQDWLTCRVDLPNLTQCEIVLGDDPYALLKWRDVLLRGFPPLTLFKFEITAGALPGSRMPRSLVLTTR